ncbi:MAG TPA: hypothetical protein VNW04_23995 [Puia sp.]|jgi:hypothetical protein|nr:hypothetical protein [Puia sp.]
MRCFWVILLVLAGYGWGARAQDLTGQWTGTATAINSDVRQKLVLSITEGDSAFGGVLHWYSPETQTIRHIIVSGRFYGKDSILTIRQDSTMNIEEGPAGGPPGGFYILFYRRYAGRRDQLEGHWHGIGGWMGTTEDMSIRLEKKAPPFIPMPVAKPPKKNSADDKQIQALLGRESVVAVKIPVPVQGIDTIRIELYDNGEIDGDSVSLFLNNQLLLQHLRLTAEARVLLVPLDKSIPVSRLVLFAENLGRLPPNTALMEVTVHGKTYTLFLSTDYKKNASVEFQLQE